jgi:hypothetical protein
MNKAHWSLLLAVAVAGCGGSSAPEPGSDSDATKDYVGDSPSTAYEQFALGQDTTYTAKRRNCTTGTDCVETGSYTVDTTTRTVTFRDDATGATRTGQFEPPAAKPGLFQAQGLSPQDAKGLVVAVCLLFGAAAFTLNSTPATVPQTTTTTERYVPSSSGNC